MNCSFCSRECKNANSQRQHQIRCKLNPNKIYVGAHYGMLGKKGGNQYTKGTAKPMSKETHDKLSVAAKNQVWSLERRVAHSATMKLAVKNFPESYTSANRGRVKQIEEDGIKFQGQWELDFYRWCITNSEPIQRCSEWFDYEFEGHRRYNPDFYLPERNLYVEVKGYKTKRDVAKWHKFPRRLCVIMKNEILLIRKNAFVSEMLMDIND